MNFVRVSQTTTFISCYRICIVSNPVLLYFFRVRLLNFLSIKSRVISNSKVHSVCALYRPGNDFELILMVQMESQHSVGVANLSWLSAICNHFEEIAAWSRKSLTKFVRAKVDLFWEKDPLRAHFHKCFPKGFMATQIHVLCANFVKIGWPEVGEIARCSPNKKTTKFRLALPLSRLRGSRPKPVRASSRQYTRSAPNFIQISSLSAELQPNVWTSLKRATKCFQYSAKLQLLRRVNICPVFIWRSL